MTSVATEITVITGILRTRATAARSRRVTVMDCNVNEKIPKATPALTRTTQATSRKGASRIVKVFGTVSLKATGDTVVVGGKLNSHFYFKSP
jgi:hypothetical protein